MPKFIPSHTNQRRYFLCATAIISLYAITCPAQAMAQDDNTKDAHIIWDEDAIILDMEDIEEEDFQTLQTDETLTLDAVDVTSSPDAPITTGARPEFAQKLTLPSGQSLNDWLESAPGVFGHTSSKGQRSIIVRGFETRHINMEFDGVPLETGYDGMTGLDVLPLNWVSSAKLYHADTNPTDGAGLGGKAAFYSAQPSPLEAALEIDRGSVRGSLAHGMQINDWRWAATAGGHYANGFYLSQNYPKDHREDGELRNNSASQSYNLMLKAGKTLQNWGDFEISGGYAQAPRQVPTGTASDYPRYWQFTDWKLAFATARLAFSTSYISGQAQVWATHQGNTLNEFDDETFTTQTIAGARSIWKDNDFGGRIELTSSPFNLASVGHISTLLKADFHWQIHQTDDFNLQKNTQETTHSERFLYDIRPAFDWQILPEIRLFASAQATGTHASKNAQLPNINNGGFNLGFDYAILDNLNIGARAARRLRIPTMKEQFRSERIGLSIPLLAPEAAWHFEFEIHYAPHSKVKLSAAAYDTEVRDLIDFTYFNGIKLAQNIDKSRLSGCDFAATFGPFYQLSLELTYSYLHAKNLTENQPLNNRPEHNLRAALSWTPLQNLKLSINTQYESKRRTEAWMNSHYAWIGDIFLLGAEVEYQIEHFALLLKGTNLTDYHYMRAHGYPEEGFNISISAKYKW